MLATYLRATVGNLVIRTVVLHCQWTAKVLRAPESVRSEAQAERGEVCAELSAW